ncbi:hypothetical protein M1563_02665 [Patescibacteria group bacterium]|nr:hypothetical protein [Patescibacteria group bacterium]MCL5409943.1 hypothetical protein [Patescibacteria group bacterium]
MNKRQLNKSFCPTIESGQILILGVIVIGLVLVNTLVIIGGSQIYSNNAKYSVEETQATNLAEAGVDKALASLNATGGSYNGDSEIQLGEGSYSVTVTTPDVGTKVIEATGYIPSKAEPKVTRTIKVSASKGLGVSFNYGVQVGEGGLQMSNGARVNGSIYSNGNVSMSNNSIVTGDAYVAGGVAPAPDQESVCTTPSCTDFVFGKNVAGNDQLDVAQSFKPSVSDYLNKISLNLKKVGSPPDITVRITKDKNGSPDKNNVIASGTLPASLVTGNYGFVEVTFTSSPQVNSGNTYWILLDTTSNATNYWSWSADSSQGYTRGAAKWSANWQATTPIWNSTLVDLDFKTFMGGTRTNITGTNGSTVQGDAHANTLNSLLINGGAYYQTANGISAGNYYPGSADPPAKAMPVSDANIQAWKDAATAAGVYTGNISSCRTTLGPGKYVGNVTFTNNCMVTIKDPVWITGYLNLSNNVVLNLDSSYGASSGVIVVDGVITLSNSCRLLGSGTAGSYLLTLTTYDSRTNGSTAVSVANSGNQGVLYAPYGMVVISNNNHMTELTAWKINLSNNVVVDYDTGLASSFFSSGPSGSFSIIKGSYQEK